VLHGGIILTLLDETLAYAAMFAVGPAVTAEIQARLRRPAPLEETYRLFGIVVKARLGLIEAHATMIDSSDRLIAEADAKFMRMR